MRNNPLTKEEKAEVERLLIRLQLVPPVAGTLAFNFDSQGKVANVEMQKVVWR